MTPAKISSSLQDRVSLYQKLAQSGNDKQNNGIERLSLVRITQSPVERKFSHLQRQRPPVEKHSSSFSHIPVSQNLSSPLSKKTDIQQQNTSNTQVKSLTSVSPKDLIQELKEKLSAVKNNTADVTNGGPHKGLSAIQQEIVQAKEEYRLGESKRVIAEEKEDARVAEALANESANELAQQTINKTRTEAEQFKVKLQFTANGVPTSAPPMPAPSLVTPSRSIELKPQDKSKQQTSTLLEQRTKNLMRELEAKLTKIQDKNDDVSNRSSNLSSDNKQQKVRDEIAKAREEYKNQEPNRITAETKEDARVAEALANELANELAQQTENKTRTETEQFKVDLKFDANGVPTSAPSLPSF
ncbi:hypothetical protein [Yersinia enterocolitica]|uniref:Uncharacterized protein n=1 Tax=Yersinia enterocolitica serotype O:8 / biotype 1B (strain NCTC 13174 / 8081) TaxID=393305 RepID=A1JM55_YERE8|nr:hypothetical protein [Yersinia enterocolitica]AJJ21733.1 hypothetical protein CH49_1422 [Yersinia enterocolitica]CAL12065.1 hypothetical protein YE1986 [Yersinia enterocolitica subsp. enterocolitica 8081]HDL8279441.1 hypothetical protein [Yersinia enterocolitica]